jgi:hypothetical protein
MFIRYEWRVCIDHSTCYTKVYQTVRCDNGHKMVVAIDLRAQKMRL